MKKRPYRHLRHQLPGIMELGKSLLASRRSRGPAQAGTTVSLELPPRKPQLVNDYVEAVGGPAQRYAGVVPPHMFPQWALPLSARCLAQAGVALAQGLNGGCRLQVKAPLPVGAPLRVDVTTASIDDSERRQVIAQHVITSVGATECLDATMYVIIPKRGGKKAKRTPATVPGGAKQRAAWTFDKDMGLSFALLTGDINPIHWMPRYAKAMGFRSTIMHGFCTMARAWEELVTAEFSGDADELRVMDVKFTKPLVLPREVGLYSKGSAVFVGDAPGGDAYMQGTFEARGAK